MIIYHFQEPPAAIIPHNTFNIIANRDHSSIAEAKKCLQPVAYQPAPVYP